jgi:hypothetical protein
MNSDSLSGALQALGRTFTPFGFIVLVLIVLIAVLFALYLVLSFGEKAVQMLIPFVTNTFDRLWSESKKSHPAIRVELLLHAVLIVFFFLMLAALLLHDLVPWPHKLNDLDITIVLISSFLVVVVLTGWSIRIASRLS